MKDRAQSDEQGQRSDPKTRVDAAHPSNFHDLPASEEPAWDVLNAIAGHDAESNSQLTGQALELVNLLYDKQQQLDQRESDLNARTAQLESDLRAVRISKRNRTPIDAGIELDAGPETGAAERDDPPRATGIASSEPQAVSAVEVSAVELAEVELADAEFVEIEIAESSCEGHAINALESRATESTAVESGADEVHLWRAPWPEPGAEPEPLEAPPEMEPVPHETDADLRQLELIEQWRGRLAERKSKLDRRQAHVERMSEQVTTLHREALEIQLSSEILWSDLMDEFPSKELAKRMQETRKKLADHYRLAQDSLAERTDDLHQLRQELNQQESKLRQQRRELQLWADRRYDEIETRTAHLIQRERELDQQESEFDRQAMQWQQQRAAYRREIERLGGPLDRSANA